jgi:hypothetical protein
LATRNLILILNGTKIYLIQQFYQNQTVMNAVGGKDEKAYLPFSSNFHILGAFGTTSNKRCDTLSTNVY